MPTTYYFMKEYTREELAEMEPIELLHNLNLLLEREGDIRLYQSRMTVEDGADGNNMVYVEMFNPESGLWENFKEYEPE